MPTNLPRIASLTSCEMINPTMHPTMPESELVFVLQIAPNMPKRDNDDIGYWILDACRHRRHVFFYLIIIIITETFCFMCFSISLLHFSWSWRNIGSNSDDYNTFSLCVASIVHFFNRHTKLTMILSLFSSTIHYFDRNYDICSRSTFVLLPLASSVLRCSISAISSTGFIHEAISIIDIKSFKMLLSVSNFGRKSRGEYIQCPTPCHLF